MTREQLEHILRASSAITGAGEFVVIGAAALLAQHPEAPAELCSTVEADIFTFRSPEDANLIDGSIGEGSPFHATFGYHAHGVGVETAILPEGWRERLVRISSPSTNGAVGLCLDVHDLAVSKLIAGRPKDTDFVRSLLTHRLADPAIIAARLGSVPGSLHAQAAHARLARVTP